MWDTISKIRAWLDASSDMPPELLRLIRIMKIAEEAGEVAQAVIGVTGQNPRKGITHTWDDVAVELCDVIVTAMVALATLTPDPDSVFAANLARLLDRTVPQLEELT